MYNGLIRRVFWGLSYTKIGRHTMPFPQTSSLIRIFFSYATSVSKDRKLFNELQKHLGVLKQKSFIDKWCDSTSSTENTLEQFIAGNTNGAFNIIVLLISSDFLSHPHSKKEVDYALELRDAKKAEIIPVLLRPVLPENLPPPFQDIQSLPLDKKPISGRSDEEEALLNVARVIWNTVEELAKSSSAHSHPRASSSPEDIPYRPNPFFTDRGFILSTLYNHFTANQHIQQTPILALSGLPGVGKTQIAIQYAYSHLHKEYETILWLAADSRKNLSTSIVSRSEQFSLSEEDCKDDQRLFATVRHWLKNHYKWLLILDHLDDDDFELIDPLIPNQSSGHILLTTCFQATGEIRAVPVVEMAIDDSALFLLRRAKLIEEQAPLSNASEEDITQAKAIAQEVDGLPLALDQAGAYIDETGYNLTDYLELYRQGKLRLLEQRGEKPFSIHPESVAVTFSLAFEKVRLKYPPALELLCLFAFLHPDAIPDEMIKAGAPVLGISLQALATHPSKLNDAMRILRKFSLVQRRNDTKMLSIHRVVQDILREKLKPTQQRRWANKVVRLVNHVFPEGDFSNWSLCASYLPHAQKCAELITEYQLHQKEAADLLQRLGSYCYWRAYYQNAEQYLIDALELYKQVVGPEHTDTAQALDSLATLYTKQGKYQEAEAYYQDALLIRKRVAESAPTEFARTLNNLALLYQGQGRYQEAEELYQRTLSIEKTTVGPDHPDIATTFNNLALLYEEQGKYSQAEQMYQDVLAIDERILNPYDPGLAISLSNLARQCKKQGDYQKAKDFYQRAFDIRGQSLGPDHPDTAQSLNNLADTYEILGEYQEAEKLYQRAFKIYEQVLGTRHSEVGRILNNLAYLARRQGHYQQAEPFYKQALKIYEQALGPEHPETADVLNNLGLLYHLMGNDKCAEPLLRRSLEIREQRLGPEHLDTARSLDALIELLIHQDHYEQAEPLGQRLLNILRQELGPEHSDVILAQEQYTLLLQHVKEQKKAI
jgi:tetratricopeptide (TPR) repeat protein